MAEADTRSGRGGGGSRFGGLLASSSVSGAGTLLSRVTGMLRDSVYAATWGGSGGAFAASTTAFMIPNLFRRLFGEGALSEAAMPVFNETLVREGRPAAFRVVNEVLLRMALVLSAVVAVGIGGCVLSSPWLPPTKAALVVRLLPILLPYTVMVCALGFLSGILQSLGQFSLPAVLPILVNGALIGAALWVCPRLGSDPAVQVRGLAYAVLVAGVAQLVLVAAVLRGYGFRPSLRAPLSDRGREVGRLMAPLVFGASVGQLNVLCDRAVAWLVGGWLVNAMYFSERLVYLPVGVFGVALSAACLPVVSRAAARGDSRELVEAVAYGLRHVLFLSLPCTVALLVLGRPAVELLYERRAFTPENSAAVTAAVLFYAPGIPAFAAVKIVRGAFTGSKDPGTPVRVGAWCLAVNVVLNLALVWSLQQRGLALATSVSAWLNAGWLTLLLWRRVNDAAAPLRAVGHSALRLIPGLAALATVAVIGRGLCPGGAGWAAGVALAAVCSAAGLCYLAVAAACGSPEARELWAMLRGRLLHR